MQRQEASILLGAIVGKRALVIGDVLLDSFVYGEVKRISREAPVPVLGRNPPGSDAGRGGQSGAQYRQSRRVCQRGQRCRQRRRWPVG